MPKLRITGGDGAEQGIDLGEATLQIGRGRDNDIVLPDPLKGVSRIHAELRFENGHYVVVDLQSQNGTWVNGRRVERAEVPLGAEIAIGAYRLTLLSDRLASMRMPVRNPRIDPLDDMRPTAPHDPPLVAPPVAANPVAGGSRRGAAALAAVLVIGLAAVAWVSGRRPDPGATGAPAVVDSPGAASERPQPSSPSVQEPAQERRIEAIDPPAGSPVKPAATPRAGAARVAGGPGIARRPGETGDAWRARAAALQTRYDYSKAALDRGDFAAATGGFEAILLEEPGFLDAPRLLVQAQAGLRASARTLFEGGRKLDDAGDWMGALQKYEQARQISTGIPGLADRMRQVRGKLTAAGTTAFNQARRHEKDGRPQEALKEYEKAMQWLPADDPNRQVARARIEHIRKND